MTNIARDPKHQQVTAQHGGVVQFESSRLLPWLMFMSILSGVAIAAAVVSLIYGTNVERETRMLEYYVMELDGKLMCSGVIESQESWSAQKQEGSK